MHKALFHIKFLFISFLFLPSSILHAQNDSIKSIFLDYWNPTRMYTYNVSYLDSANHALTNEKLIIHPTGETWTADNKQTLADFYINFSAEDSAKLAGFSFNGNARAWTKGYKEGVLQDKQKIWMHPLRSNQYVLTELAPFPEAHFPLIIGDSWKTTLMIYAGFGSFEGTVEAAYTVIGREVRTYDFGKLLCWKILAIGTHDKLGENAAEYYFNETCGFTEMNYTFYNRYKINLRLCDFKF
jgi:hypothetical protein